MCVNFNSMWLSVESEASQTNQTKPASKNKDNANTCTRTRWRAVSEANKITKVLYDVLDERQRIAIKMYQNCDSWPCNFFSFLNDLCYSDSIRMEMKLCTRNKIERLAIYVRFASFLNDGIEFLADEIFNLQNVLTFQLYIYYWRKCPFIWRTSHEQMNLSVHSLWKVLWSIVFWYSFSATLNKFINYNIESIAQFDLFQLNLYVCALRIVNDWTKYIYTISFECRSNFSLFDFNWKSV